MLLIRPWVNQANNLSLGYLVWSRGSLEGDAQGTSRGLGGMYVQGALGCLDRRLECLKRSMAIGPLMIGKTGDLQGPRGLRGMFRGPRGFLKAYQDTKLACFKKVQLGPLGPCNTKPQTNSKNIGVRARTPCTFWDNYQFRQNFDFFCVNQH